MTTFTVVEVDGGWRIISTSTAGGNVSPIMPEAQAFRMATALTYIATTPLPNK